MFGSGACWQGKIPEAALFSAVPFGPEADEYLAWLFKGNGMALYQEMYDAAGYKVKVLPYAVISPETSGWFSKPIESPDDLKGLRMRFFGLGGKVMQKLGFYKAVKYNYYPGWHQQAAASPRFAKIWEDLSRFRADYAYWKSLGFLPRESRK